MPMIKSLEFSHGLYETRNTSFLQLLIAKRSRYSVELCYINQIEAIDTRTSPHICKPCLEIFF